MSYDIPDPDLIFPSTRPDLGSVVILKNGVTSPLIEVGELTYTTRH